MLEMDQQGYQERPWSPSRNDPVHMELAAHRLKAGSTIFRLRARTLCDQQNRTKLEVPLGQLLNFSGC